MLQDFTDERVEAMLAWAVEGPGGSLQAAKEGTKLRLDFDSFQRLLAQLVVNPS